MIPARRTALLPKPPTREHAAQYFIGGDVGAANSV
jgi:hypothetical protein